MRSQEGENETNYTATVDRVSGNSENEGRESENTRQIFWEPTQPCTHQYQITTFVRRELRKPPTEPNQLANNCMY